MEAEWTQAGMLEARVQQTTGIPGAFFWRRGYKSQPLLPLSSPSGPLGLDLQPEKRANVLLGIF